MPLVPGGISLDLVLDAPDAHAVAERVMPALRREGQPNDFWAGTRAEKPRRVPPADYLTQLSADRSIHFTSFRNGEQRAIVRQLKGDPTGWKVYVMLNPESEGDPTAGIQQVLSAAADLLRDLFDHDMVRTGRVGRVGGGADVLPVLPIVDTAVHAVVTTAAEIDAAYEDRDAFLHSGWTEVRERNGRILLTRATESATARDFLAAVHDGHRAMARIAKPGLTKYRGFGPKPDEQSVYEQPEALQTVGYTPDDRTLHFSSALAGDEHVTGRDVDRIARIAGARKLPDGRPVDRVRVVFLDEAVARRERRPLLDAGAEVHYLDRSGAEREVGE